MKYTNEMLNAAGVSTNDVVNISIYQYSEELYGYVCIGGTIDTKKQEVKTEIKEAGQYLLAVDIFAPTVSEVCISKDTNKPLITVYFDEMSGFQKLSFCLDGQELINDSNWKKYYNAASFCISYQVEKELPDGAHKLSIYAVDSAGNAMSEPFVFEFYIGEGGGKPDIPQPDYGDILPEDIPADGVIPEGLWISDVTPQDYTGAAIKPAVRVYNYKTLLTEKKDYAISYKNNIKANDAKTAKTAPAIIVTGKGNCTGKETMIFQIEPKTDFQIKYTDTSSQAYQRVGRRAGKGAQNAPVDFRVCNALKIKPFQSLLRNTPWAWYNFSNNKQSHCDLNRR